MNTQINKKINTAANLTTADGQEKGSTMNTTYTVQLDGDLINLHLWYDRPEDDYRMSVIDYINELYYDGETKEHIVFTLADRFYMRLDTAIRIINLFTIDWSVEMRYRPDRVV
jgi:hypothetical protein